MADAAFTGCQHRMCCSLSILEYNQCENSQQPISPSVAVQGSPFMRSAGNIFRSEKRCARLMVSRGGLSI